MQWTGWVRGWTQSEVRNLHRTPAGACGTQECAAHGARAILAEPEHPAGLLSPSPHRHSHSELIKTEEVAHRALNLAQKSKPTSRSQGVDCFSSLCHCCWRGRIWVVFFFWSLQCLMLEGKQLELSILDQMQNEMGCWGIWTALYIWKGQSFPLVSVGGMLCPSRFQPREPSGGVQGAGRRKGVFRNCSSLSEADEVSSFLFLPVPFLCCWFWFSGKTEGRKGEVANDRVLVWRSCL